jgi:POT family proton-dependent oligopeptide transporter
MSAGADGFPISGNRLSGDRTFLGHPRGLAYLAFTEGWERFSFYGMTALLLLYMIQRLLTPEVMDGVIGLGMLRDQIESVTGPLSNQAFASQVYGLYSGLVYFTPVFGGLIADRLLGQRRTVMLGAMLMSAGHILMVFDASFLIALGLLILGSGCLKGNISAQVGHLYPLEDDGRRTRAFAIFSAAINVGALFGPATCALMAQIWGWHFGFGLAGVLMLIALAIYVAGWRYLPPDRMRVRGGPKSPPMTARDWKVVAALLLLIAITVLPVIAYYQQMNAGVVFIEQDVAREVFGWSVPAGSFISVDGFFCILLVAPLIALWRAQARRGKEPGELNKIAIGFLIAGIANLVMIVPAMRADAGAQVSLIWPVLLYGLNALGFLFYWPTMLALFSRAAPAGINSTMMGILFFAIFFGNVIVGALAGLWEKILHAHFFALHASFAFLACALILAIARPLTRILASDSP